MDLFATIVCSFKSITILIRNSILRSVTGSWICLGYFFRFTLSIDLLISRNLFKNQLNFNSAHKCLFKEYIGSIALGVGPVWIWQQGNQNNVCNVVSRFWLPLWRLTLVDFAPDQMFENNLLQMCLFSIILTSLHSFSLSLPLLFYVISTAILKFPPWFPESLTWFLTFLHFNLDSSHCTKN